MVGFYSRVYRSQASSGGLKKKTLHFKFTSRCHINKTLINHLRIDLKINILYCCSAKPGRRKVMVIAKLFPIQIAVTRQPRRPTARLQRLRGRTPSRKVRKNVINFFCFTILPQYNIMTQCSKSIRLPYCGVFLELFYLRK